MNYRPLLVFLSFLTLLFSTFVQAQTTWNNVAIGGGGFVTGVIPSRTQANLWYARTDVGGAYRWDNATTKWVPLLDWCSINETTYQGVESLALDAQNSANLYMLVGTSYFNGGKTAILRSTDYGATFSITDVSAQFKAHGNGMGRQNGERLAVDPNNNSILFCGSRANGLWKSTNSGTSFSLVSSLAVTTTPNGNGINFVVFDPAGTVGTATQTFYVGISRTGAGTNLYKTTDGGTSFTAITGGPATMPQRAVLASDKNLYVTFADNEGPWNITSGSVWKYNTTTNVWTNITPAGFTTGFGGISVDPTNPNRIIVSTINAYWSQYVDVNSNTVWGDRMLISLNGGTTWRDLVNTGIVLNANSVTWINQNSIHWAGDIQFDPFNPLKAQVISGNGIFSCDDVSQTTTAWKFNSIGIEETVPLDIVSITGGQLVSVIGDYDGFRHSTVTNFSPIHTPRMGTTTGVAVAPANSNTWLRVGNSMYYSTNAGTTWTQCSSMNGSQGRVAVSANGTVFLHCPSGSATTYRSTNNGTSWTTCNGINVSDAMPVADMVNTNKIYAYNPTSGNMMVSTDAGANFATSGAVGTGGSRIIRTVPGQEGHIWVALYGGGLKRSTNSGTSFTTITTVSACSAIGLGKAAPSATYHTLYIWGTVAGITGIFMSIDEGATWTRINDDAHEFGGPGNGQFVIGDMNTYGRVYMSTVGRGIVYADISSPAPVELIGFDAKNTGNREVQLTWTTASELNNAFFEVQRSENGLDFDRIIKVFGKGTSDLQTTYEAFDTAVVPGKIYFYRLKQVDFDGQFEYSTVKKVLVSGTVIDISIAPNPASESVFVGGFSSENELISYEILDVLGVCIAHGTLNKMLRVDGFPRGIYTVRGSVNGRIFVKKLVLE